MLEAGGQEPGPTEMLAPRLLLHTSFLSPLCTLWLWTKPVARDFLYQAPMRNMTISVCVLGGAEGLGVSEAMGWKDSGLGKEGSPKLLACFTLVADHQKGLLTLCASGCWWRCACCGWQ